MTSKWLKLRWSCVLLLCCVGCQTWHNGTPLSSLTDSSGERQIVKQAKQDPFPSPSDVGIASHQ